MSKVGHERRHQDRKGHDHGGVFGHAHAGPGRLKLAFFLNLAVVAVELVGGFSANSLERDCGAPEAIPVAGPLAQRGERT